MKRHNEETGESSRSAEGFFPVSSECDEETDGDSNQGLDPLRVRWVHLNFQNWMWMMRIKMLSLSYRNKNNNYQLREVLLCDYNNMWLCYNIGYVLTKPGHEERENYY